MIRFLSIIFVAFVAGMLVQLLAIKQDAQSNQTDRLFRASPILARYATQVAEAAKPGPNSKEFVKTVGNDDPTAAVASLYKRVIDRWAYVSDPEDTVDWLRPAERMLVDWEGDCEDFAILMASLLQSLPTSIDCRIVLAGPSDDNNQHHAFVELRLCDAGEDEQPLLDELGRHWRAGKLRYRRDAEGLWLALDGGVPPVPHTGQPRLAISPDGRVVHFEELRNFTFRSDTKGTLR